MRRFSYYLTVLAALLFIAIGSHADVVHSSSALDEVCSFNASITDASDDAAVRILIYPCDFVCFYFVHLYLSIYTHCWTLYLTLHETTYYIRMLLSKLMTKRRR